MERFLNTVLAVYLKTHRFYNAFHKFPCTMPGKSKRVVNHKSQDSDAIKYQIETDQLAQELKKKMGLKPKKKVNDDGSE